MYEASNSPPASRAFSQSLSFNSPSNLSLSQRPYHGSMHTNGACFFGGDQISCKWCVKFYCQISSFLWIGSIIRPFESDALQLPAHPPSNKCSSIERKPSVSLYSFFCVVTTPPSPNTVFVSDSGAFLLHP